MLKRWLTGVLLATVVLCVVVPGEGRFYMTDKGAKVWVSPSEGWAVGGIGRWPVEKLPLVMPERPAGAEGFRLVELMVREPGEWLSFGVDFRRVQRVVFTRSTKIVLVDKEGKRYESEGCFFCPDEEQTQVYDSRKMAVVVTKGTVYCRARDRGRPLLTVKFPADKFRLKDIVEFEVVGAVEDSTERGMQ